jgi:hypothetical protein
VKNSLVTSIGSVLLLAACSSAPPDEATASSAAAVCGGGKVSWCGPCVADPGTPEGGTRTCYLCSGVSYTQECVPPPPTPPPPPPPIDATWSGHVWVWSGEGDTNGDFSFPVVFNEESGTWLITVPSLKIPLGVTITLQSKEEGWGSVNGDDATMTLPLSVASQDVTVSLSTDATISPPGVQPIHVYAYSPSLFQMVGEGTLDGNPFDVFFSGTITAWPNP